MSALPPKADIRRLGSDVRFVPEGDIARARSITSSAMASKAGGIEISSSRAVVALLTIAPTTAKTGAPRLIDEAMLGKLGSNVAQ